MPLKINNSNNEEVKDTYNSFEKWEDWKKNKTIEGISKKNEGIIIKFLIDMERGRNVSNQSKKGSRSYRRLVDLKRHFKRITEMIEEHLQVDDLTKLTEKEEELVTFFDNLRKGKIKKTKGKGSYKSVPDFVKNFKAFWHWYQKYAKKEEGKAIPDITVDLDGSKEKPKFHYITFEQLKKLADHSKYDYKILQYFLFDSGARPPQEVINIKVKDITPIENNEYLQLNIRDEISKTFGRKIKLMVCHNLLKEYIKDKKPEEFVFNFSPNIANKYLTRLGYKVLGIGKAVKDKKGNIISVSDGLTMYDYRHSSSCYWLPRYKSESALKYRFGWKKSEMIYYYSEYLGMKDTIEPEDMLVDVTKTELEKKLEEERQKLQLMEERMKGLEELKGKVESNEKYFELLNGFFGNPKIQREFKQFVGKRN